MGFSPTLSPFSRVAVKNAVGTIIQSFLKNLKFTGGATVTQVGNDTVVNITPGGIAGDPNTVAFFDSLGNITDDLGNFTYDSATKVFRYPTFTTAQRNALPAQPVGTLIFNSTTTTFQTWDGALWNDTNAGSATPPPGDFNAIATFGPTGAFGDDPEFVWIAASRRFGIGRTSPQCLIQVRGDDNAGAGAFAADGIIFGFTHPTQNLGAGSFIIGGVSTGENYAPGDQSFVGGQLCGATSLDCFSFGQGNIASGPVSVAFGIGTLASAITAFAEGSSTIASGTASHAEGQSTTASGDFSHSQNNGTTASGNSSTAMGDTTVAQGYAQLVLGKQNVPQGNPAAFIDGDDSIQVGNNTARNPFSVTNNGRVRSVKTVLLQNGIQTLVAGFIVTLDEELIPIQSGAPVTSDLVTPITDGDEDGLQLKMINVGPNNITFKAGGNVKTPGGVDLVLTQYSSVTLSWLGTLWYVDCVSFN